jgi:hypothetical protein
MLQTGGCHFDKWIVPSERNHPVWIVPSERNHPVFLMRDLIDCVENNLSFSQ